MYFSKGKRSDEQEGDIKFTSYQVCVIIVFVICVYFYLSGSLGD